MTTIDARARSPRGTLVAEIRRRLDRETFPRLIVLAMLVGAGLGTFLCSAIALAAGFESMAPRYALATASGYVVFLLLIRMWIAVRRGWFPDEGGLIDAAIDLAGTPGRAAGQGSSEGLVDAALVGAVYRRLRRRDRGHWATTALRQTWVSAAVLVTFMGALGFALQHLSPDAVSIGDVVRRVVAR